MNSSSLIDSFTLYLKRKDKSRSTIIAYKNDLLQILEICKPKEIYNLNENEIKTCLVKLQKTKSLTTKSLSRKLNAIRTFYKYLIKHGVIKENPTLTINHPKFKAKPPRILIKMEYLELKESTRDNLKLYTMIEILLQTGIRISELAALKIKNIYLTNTRSYLLIDKDSKDMGRKVQLNPKVTKILKQYIKENDLEDLNTPNAYLFRTKTGKGIQIRNIRNSIDKVIAKCKIRNACVNDLRNTFIVYQLSTGLPVELVSEIVGHKNKSTTEKYLELLHKKYKEYGDRNIREL